MALLQAVSPWSGCSLAPAVFRILNPRLNGFAPHAEVDCFHRETPRKFVGVGRFLRGWEETAIRCGNRSMPVIPRGGIRRVVSVVQRGDCAPSDWAVDRSSGGVAPGGRFPRGVFRVESDFPPRSAEGPNPRAYHSGGHLFTRGFSAGFGRETVGILGIRRDSPDRPRTRLCWPPKISQRKFGERAFAQAR